MSRDENSPCYDNMINNTNQLFLHTACFGIVLFRIVHCSLMVRYLM